jgi:hypothetical protein
MIGHHAAGMVENEQRVCPVCGGPIQRVSLALFLRREDGRRVCKAVLLCSDHSHIVWRWNDRPYDEWLPDDSLAHLFRS